MNLSAHVHLQRPCLLGTLFIGQFGIASFISIDPNLDDCSRVAIRRNNSLRRLLHVLPQRRSTMAMQTREMEARETGSLIGSDKVEGTAVYGANDTKIGSIERVMIDKMSGRVSYAVLSFGGFLGIGDDHYPLPWQSLKYDTNLGGYRTGITETQLKGAPKYSNDNAWNWNDPARARAVNDYYGVAIP
jgi:PRC-barrel domain